MKFKLSFLISGVLLLATSCGESYPPTDMTNNSIIPKPASVVATNGTFVLEDDAIIYYDAGNDALRQKSEYLADLLRPSTGYEFEIEETSNQPGKGNIWLTTNAELDTTLGYGSYELSISEASLKISSSEPEGVFYGIQTLRQLLPAKIEKEENQEGPWLLPTGTIRDWPQFQYRGAMLDVSRHFFDVETVKRFIDYISLFKMNRLHLHLSDDQGWRIEIESWPNLTEHGGSTQVGGGRGGFYTKEDYKEIVNYAADRNVMVIPEIDMPGHTNAALASYPELNCDGKAPELYTGMKVGFSTLCTSKDVVYEFVDDVVREISEITPGPYFHIGGDESFETEDDDYVYFINRAREIVRSHGKQVIGWDEIAHADLDEQDILQFWAKEKNAIEGHQKGAKVIMSPSKHAYLDIKYNEETELGLDWAGLTDVEDAYNWDPVTLVDGIEIVDVLGVEAPLWSETIENLEDIEYLMFPRIAGHAEIGWTVSEQRIWKDYEQRLGRQKARFEAMNINYYQSPQVSWQEEPGIFIDGDNTDEEVAGSVIDMLER